MIPLVLCSARGFRASAMFALGPLGTALIALAVATTRGFSDAAILYSWPVLWVAYFFGTRRVGAVVVSVGLAHGAAMLADASGEGNVDRWLDVMVSTTMIAAVVQVLASRNRGLVTQLTAEARVDPLTGLLNRRGLAERLEVSSPAPGATAPRSRSWPSTSITSRGSTTPSVTTPATTCSRGSRRRSRARRA